MSADEAPANPALATSRLPAGNPYGSEHLERAREAAAAAEPLVYVPVMLSRAGDGRVAHYAASFDDGATWRPACGSDLRLEPLPDEFPAPAVVVTPCPQCSAWARQARRAEN